MPPFVQSNRSTFLGRFFTAKSQTQFSNFICTEHLQSAQCVQRLTAATVFSGLLLSTLNSASACCCCLLGPILIANCLAGTLYALLGLHFSCHAPDCLLSSSLFSFPYSCRAVPFFPSLSLAASLAMRFYFYATLVSHCIIRLTPLGGALLHPVMALLTQLLCPVSDRRAAFIFYIFHLLPFRFFSLLLL